MVSYQAWVSIVFETLQGRGVEVSDIDDGASMMRFAGDTWQNYGNRLKRMTESQARSAALELARQYS